MTSSKLALLVPAVTLGLFSACDSAVNEPSAAADEADEVGDAEDGPASEEGGTDEGDEESTPSEDEESDTGYSIRGRTLATMSHTGSSQPDGLGASPHASLDEGCPFDPASEPCNAEVCHADPPSPECKDVIEGYCESNPADPACDPDGGPHEPGDDPGPDGTPGEEPPPGETWACEADPAWPPCEVCLDPDASDDDCGQAWWEHCSEHPGDVWCEHDDEPPEAVYAPTSLSVLVYQVEFSLDAEACSDPILVGEPDTPHYVDFTSGPELVDAVLPPDGSYACVIITMSDHIQWSVDGDNPCAGEHAQDVSGDEGVEETVRLYLSTAGDSGRDGSDAFEAPGLFLGGALEVGPGIVSSDFVVTFPEGVHYRPDRDRACEMQKPEFSFETRYE